MLKCHFCLVVLIGKNKEDLEENQNFLDLFKTYPATLKATSGTGLYLTHKLNVKTLKLHVDVWAGRRISPSFRQNPCLLRIWIQVKNKTGSGLSSQVETLDSDAVHQVHSLS